MARGTGESAQRDGTAAESRARSRSAPRIKKRGCTPIRIFSRPHLDAPGRAVIKPPSRGGSRGAGKPASSERSSPCAQASTCRAARGGLKHGFLLATGAVGRPMRRGRAPSPLPRAEDTQAAPTRLDPKDKEPRLPADAILRREDGKIDALASCEIGSANSATAARFRTGQGRFRQ